MGLTKEYQKKLDKISIRRDSPFPYPLKDYILDIVDKPRCQYCHKIGLSGVQLGVSPKFNQEWFYGSNVCLHTCDNCHCKVFNETQKYLKSFLVRS